MSLKLAANKSIQLAVVSPGSDFEAFAGNSFIRAALLISSKMRCNGRRFDCQHFAPARRIASAHNRQVQTDESLGTTAAQSNS